MATVGTWILGAGFLVFLVGVFMGGQSVPHASAIAIAGMLILFRWRGAASEGDLANNPQTLLKPTARLCPEL